jgi:hypothetical protein
MMNFFTETFRLVKTGKQLVCEAKQKFSVGAATSAPDPTHQSLDLDIRPQDTDQLFI